MKAIVITGVSSGIGLATAKGVAGHGVHVFGSVRKAEDAERLSRELGGHFTPLRFDVTDVAAVQAAVATVREAIGNERLLGLVNNAGTVIPGPVLHQDVEAFRAQLEINLVGPFVVTQAFLPLLGTERGRTGEPGRIINISSISGQIGMPFLSGYCASKHGLEGFSESLRRELMPYGIDVHVLAPGSVATPIWTKGRAAFSEPYANTDYAEALELFRQYAVAQENIGLPPEEIAAHVWRTLTDRRPRTRRAVVPQRLFNWTLPRLLPTRLMDRFLAKQLHLDGRN